MKWLLDLIWPKSSKTMADVESSYGNSPYENLQPPAWNVSAAVNNGFLSAVLGRALVEAGDNQRAVLLVTRLNTVSVLSSLPSDVTILYGLMGV